MKISDEQRRKVAVLLRKEADGWAEDCPDTVTCESYDYYEFILDIADSADIDLSKPPSMLFDRLAALIDRPTCSNAYDDSGMHVAAHVNWFDCSECHCKVRTDMIGRRIRYCPNCGAEVVE